MRRTRAAVHLGRTFGLALMLIAGPAMAEDPVDTTAERLDRQEREIEELRQQVDDLRTQVPPPVQHPEYEREDGQLTLTDYPNPIIRMDIAGQVNPAMNLAGDGMGSTKLYFVDNDVSASRIRFAGVGVFEQGLQLGTTLEVGLSPNNSFDVSQNSQVTADFISVRRAEVWARDDRFGRVMLGLGSTASNNAAAFDLTLVGGPIMMSGVSFIAGGLQFTNTSPVTGATVLSGVTVGAAFFNFDGTRDSRIRYDTPMVGPFQISASVSADQQYSGAITFGGDYDHWTAKQLGGFTMLGTVSITDPNAPGVGLRFAGSWSTLHDASGVSLTVASGFDDADIVATPYNVYAKLGWDTRLLKVGDTGFGVDYTWTENVSAAGDQGQSVGIAAVQSVDRFGLQTYAQFRWYGVDRGVGPSFNDIFVGTLGALVRF